MNKDIIVTIKGTQNNDESGVETTSKGQYYYRRGSHYIKYVECLDPNEEKTNNLIKINENKVVINKQNTRKEKTTMEFEKSCNTIINYLTPYGNLLLDAYTNNIIIRRAKETMEISLEYCLLSHGEEISKHRVKINIKNA